MAPGIQNEYRQSNLIDTRTDIVNLIQIIILSSEATLLNLVFISGSETIPEQLSLI